MLVEVAFLPPSFIPALQNIGILHHKKAELRILLQQSVLDSIVLVSNEKKKREFKIFGHFLVSRNGLRN